MPCQNETAARQDQLTGALIGLARAAAGNDELVTERTLCLTREALRATMAGAADVALQRLLTQVAAEKATLAPNCANCDHPCGRNDDYDMENLRAEGESTGLKRKILSLLRQIAASPCADDAADRFLLRMLEMLGNEWDVADLQQMARRAEAILLRLSEEHP